MLTPGHGGLFGFVAPELRKGDEVDVHVRELIGIANTDLRLAAEGPPGLAPIARRGTLACHRSPEAGTLRGREKSVQIFGTVVRLTKSRRAVL